MIIFAYLLIFLLGAVIAFGSIMVVIVAANILSLVITHVPPVSTDKKYFARIFQQFRITPQTVIYDLGCGTGNFLLAAERFMPAKCVGYELSLMPYLSAQFKAIFMGRGKIKVRFKSLFKADISDADIVYVYLVPPLLGRVSQKLQHELKPGAIALIRGAQLPGRKYCNKITLDDKRGYPLFVYKF